MPEDNPDLVDLKQIRHLTGAESEISSFDSFQVKTELKEESEENRFAREDIEMVTDYMSNGVEENVNCKTRKKLLNRTKIKCEQCGVMCRDKNGYKLHVMDHTGERPFKCSLCEKSYKKSMDLTYHMISHTG